LAGRDWLALPPLLQHLHFILTFSSQRRDFGKLLKIGFYFFGEKNAGFL
jgi:hypothetical protein